MPHASQVIAKYWFFCEKKVTEASCKFWVKNSVRGTLEKLDKLT